MEHARSAFPRGALPRGARTLPGPDLHRLETLTPVDAAFSIASRRWAARAIAWLWPARCGHCGSDLPGRQRHGLCPACWAELTPPSGRRCRSCGNPAGAFGQSRCAVCRAAPPPWSRFVHAVDYVGAARRLLLTAKEGPRPEAMGDLTALLVTRLRRAGELPTSGVVVPVPSSRAARLRRGFAPSETLALDVARAAGRPLFRALRRRGFRPTQRGRSGRARRRRDAAVRFRLVATPPPGPILLVDDLRTTGASLDACARLLAGVHRGPIVAASWAMSPDPSVVDRATGPYNAGLP